MCRRYKRNHNSNSVLTSKQVLKKCNDVAVRKYGISYDALPAYTKNDIYARVGLLNIY